VTSKRYIAVAFFFALVGCGPEGRSIGDIPECPEQPLYRFEYDTATKTWTRILVASDAGEPVSGSAAEDIAKAEGNCITGPGNAQSIEGPASGSGGSGSGGSGSGGTGGAPGDAGVD
jgi:hypothetical protein